MREIDTLIVALAAGALFAAIALLSDSAIARNYTVLYAFGTNANDGNTPGGNMAIDSSGSLYGSTYLGGPRGYGIVYRLSPSGVETVLHAFSGGSDGAGPSGVTLDQSGNIFGATSRGGPRNRGVVYKIAPDGTETILHAFAGGTDGAIPVGPVTLDAAGDVYGVTTDGGGLRRGRGTIFKLAPDGTETLLYVFNGGKRDGFQPDFLTMDQSGNLYGTTFYGGGLCRYSGCGTVFELNASGQETVLHAFDGHDGLYPDALAVDGNGNLYGTTYAGGGSHGNGCYIEHFFGCGTVFELAQAQSFRTLLDFHDGAMGAYPEGLTLDASGDLFGVAANGGRTGEGTLFEISSNGIAATLHTFNAKNGYLPGGGIILDKSGNLYGNTARGGNINCGCGVVFELAGADSK